MNSEAKWYGDDATAHDEPHATLLKTVAEFVRPFSLSPEGASSCPCPGASAIAKRAEEERESALLDRCVPVGELGESERLGLRSCIRRRRRTARPKKGSRPRTVEDGVKVDACMELGHRCEVGVCPPEAALMRAELHKAGFSCLATQPTFKCASAGYVAKLDVLCLCPGSMTLEVVECKVGCDSDQLRRRAEVQAELQREAVQESLRSPTQSERLKVGSAWVLVANASRRSQKTALTPVSPAARAMARELIHSRRKKIGI